MSERQQLTLVVFALVAVALVADFIYESCTRTSAATIAPTQADSLLAVKIPDDMPARMIDYPGFTVSFNAQAHEPNYVAWELLGSETSGAATRDDGKFMADESVYGSATPDDYRRSGYDRGHMCPAGDMKWSVEAMRSCFYMTNMCPQAKALNTGAWKKVEEMCRNWARRDSALMIVCGPVLTDRLTETIGGTGVVVPRRFFKVVLAPYVNPPKAIGFVMENGKVVGGAQAAACTVDEVENITGYDFFSALPDDIENEVERQCNLTEWQHR